jgi:hypothetical protein
MHVTCTNHITAGACQELAGGKADQGDEEEPEPRCVHIGSNGAFVVVIVVVVVVVIIIVVVEANSN